MGIGFISGIISCIGFSFISNYIENKLLIWDTCGINNLHGMPGIFGGIISAIAIICATDTNYPNANDIFHWNSFYKQAGYQLLGLVITLGIAIIGGLFTGLILKKFLNVTKYPYKDHLFFEIPETIKRLRDFSVNS